MLPLDHPFRVTTGSSRRPTPTDFVHLLTYVEKKEDFILLRSTEEITNVNQQLDQAFQFYVSNVLSRVIAQIIGQTPFGFSTIKASQEGALHVIQAGDLSTSKIYGTEPIAITSGGDTVIITGTSGTQIKVVTIVLSVDGAVTITFKSGTNDISGPMPFGGATTPNGMVAPHGPGPVICNTAENFIINLSVAAIVSGYCTYYKE